MDQLTTSMSVLKTNLRFWLETLWVSEALPDVLGQKGTWEENVGGRYRRHSQIRTYQLLLQRKAPVYTGTQHGPGGWIWVAHRRN